MFHVITDSQHVIVESFVFAIALSEYLGKNARVVHNNKTIVGE
jgi:hypothetical protein